MTICQDSRHIRARKGYHNTIFVKLLFLHNRKVSRKNFIIGGGLKPIGWIDYPNMKIWVTLSRKM